MFYIYILKSQRDKRLYIGYTQNLQKRLEEHNSGKNKSTKNRVPLDLVYYESFRNKQDAIKREKNLKQFKNSYSHLKNRIGKSLKN